MKSLDPVAQRHEQGSAGSLLGLAMLSYLLDRFDLECFGVALTRHDTSWASSCGPGVSESQGVLIRNFWIQ